MSRRVQDPAPAPESTEHVCDDWVPLVASTTIQDDDHLFFPVAANEVWTAPVTAEATAAGHVCDDWVPQGDWASAGTGKGEALAERCSACGAVRMQFRPTTSDDGSDASA